jgi:hypothetical protein
MLLKKGPLTADIDVHIRYTLELQERATNVVRDLDLAIQIPGLLKAAEPLVVWVFRKENVRILAELKRYVETQPKEHDHSRNNLAQIGIQHRARSIGKARRRENAEIYPQIVLSAL